MPNLFREEWGDHLFFFYRLDIPAMSSGRGDSDTNADVPVFIHSSSGDMNVFMFYRQHSSGCACSSDCAPGVSALIDIRKNFIGKKKYAYTSIISNVL